MSTGQYADKINWVASKHDQIIISKIADRATLFGNMSKNVVMMDITACHLNGCPLRLFDLLNANHGHFFHDIVGINEHINRETGKLQDLFLPRYHAQEMKMGTAQIQFDAANLFREGLAKHITLEQDMVELDDKTKLIKCEPANVMVALEHDEDGDDVMTIYIDHKKGLLKTSLGYKDEAEMLEDYQSIKNSESQVLKSVFWLLGA